MSASLDTAPPGWEGILEPGEQILWQGAPMPGIRNEFENAFEPIFMIFWTGFSVFWMVMASKAGGFFWTFGLLFFAIGLYKLFGVHAHKAFERRHTYYTLTSQRAFIARNTLGRKTLDSFPIEPETQISLITRGRYEDLHFGARTRRGKNGTPSAPIGFERIADARDVMGLMRQIQHASRPAAGPQTETRQ